MTNDNLAAGKGASASGSANSDWHAAGLTDGVETKGWSSARWGGQTGSAWCQIDLGADTRFNKVRLLSRVLNGAVRCFPLSYTIEAITNAGVSTPVAGVEDAAAPAASDPWVEHTFGIVTARYIKLTAARVNGDDGSGGWYAQIMEFEVYANGLDALIADALELDEDMYTAPSWQALQAAIAAAQIVSADADATDEEIDAAYGALLAAMSADLAIDKRSISLKAGETAQIIATPSEGVSWSSS
ncbi:MAG: discoidin domain-containing protein, partial [Oscillospiraceae bacterium]|nr:discoidin domain-containing protein [Oscillospiraceae bacterium]